jgi:Peptidase M66
MLNVEFPQARGMRARVSALVARRRALSLLALLAWSAGCGANENIIPSMLNPVLAGDAGVPQPDGGFPNPVFQPPPGAVPASDGGLPPITSGPIFPVGPLDAGMAPRDAGRPVDTGPTGPAPIFDSGPPADPSVSNPCGTGPEPLAANINVTEIAIYQTVKVPLFKDGAWVTTRNAAVVQGKKSMVRAFVAPQGAFAPHALRGVLTLDNGGTRVGVAAERMISGASTEENTNSTFDFQVDGALLTGTTQLSVSLLETTCVAPAATPGARVPATGGQALGADAISKFRVVVVPVTLGGSTPDTSEAQLERYRAELLAYYPVPDVEVTTRAAVSYTGSFAASGTGWSQVLSLVGRTRQTDAPPSGVYYYGVVTPAATFRDYCRSGCVAGLAPQTVVVSRMNQIGLGIGFADTGSANTMAHELGHAHGLPHAPCSRGGAIQGADTRFPYAGAKIGSWGWDSRTNKLMSPSMFVDVMSYCNPVWISDYNYAKIATRAKAVNTAAFIYAGDTPAQIWHGIILHADGSASWSGMSSDELPGEPSAASALDAAGQVLSEIEVVRVPLSHIDDVFLYVPAPRPDWSAIDLGDRVLELSEIADAPE